MYTAIPKSFKTSKTLVKMFPWRLFNTAYCICLDALYRVNAEAFQLQFCFENQVKVAGRLSQWSTEGMRQLTFCYLSNAVLFWWRCERVCCHDATTNFVFYTVLFFLFIAYPLSSTWKYHSKIQNSPYTIFVTNTRSNKCLVNNALDVEKPDEYALCAL